MRLLTEDLARAGLWALLAATDVYLSLHSSESLGLTILEAMSLGVPAVATGFGGNIDYLDDGNGVLVPFRLVPARGGIYEGLGDWAEPDIEAAAAGLVGLRDDPGLRRRLGKAARETVHKRYTPLAYRDRVRGRLRSLGLP